MNCIFCSCPLSETEGSIVPSAAMETAIRAGFTPEMSHCWERMKRIAYESLQYSNWQLTDQVLSDQWKQWLTYPGRTWRLCDQCFPPLFQYLPKDPAAMARMNSSGLGWGTPIHTSAWAMIAGYAGLLAIFCFPAPFAFILGIIALGDIRANPYLGGKERAIFAIVMGVVFSILLGLFLGSLMLSAIMTPPYTGPPPGRCC